MTVIAFDGEYLVADGRTNGNGMIITENKRKIIELDPKFRFCSYPRNLYSGDYLKYIAVSGDCDAISSYLKFLYDGIEYKNLNATALLFTLDHIYRSDGDAFYDIGDEPVTIGSGAPYALTAMRMGKSAEKAVKIACSIDVYSGGTIFKVKVR